MSSLCVCVCGRGVFGTAVLSDSLNTCRIMLTIHFQTQGLQPVAPEPHAACCTINK